MISRSPDRGQGWRLSGRPGRYNPIVSSDRKLWVFTKPARPGRVKTRLIGELTSDQAAELHGAFLGDLLARLRSGPFDLEIAWALEEADSLPPGSDWGVRGRRQVGSTLGERLYRALAEAARDHPFVAAVGSDHPELSLATVAAAFEALEAGRDAVLGPATDGGYYLIALRASSVRREIFSDIPWSTGEVLAETRRRCHELDLDLLLLEPGHDVDTPDDLERLVATLAAAPEPGSTVPPCPRTRELLVSWGRLAAL